MISPTVLLSQLGARDRTLFLRCAILDSSLRARRFWTTLTHAGGATVTILAAVLPMLLGGALAVAAQHALATLVVSHLIVQLVKRTVVDRDRRASSRAWLGCRARPLLVPSGHAAAAMSVAFVYASAYRLWHCHSWFGRSWGDVAGVLGVHYPGDV